MVGIKLKTQLDGWEGGSRLIKSEAGRRDEKYSEECKKTITIYIDNLDECKKMLKIIVNVVEFGHFHLVHKCII